MRQATEALLSGAMVALLTVSAHAQSVMPPRFDSAALRARLAHTMASPDKPMPSDVANLEALLKAKSDLALRRRLQSVNKNSDILLDMNWEQEKIYNGANFLIPYAYMIDAWRLGSALPSPQGDELKKTAAMFFLYTYSVAFVDAAECSDASAPGHRIDQLVIDNRPIGQYLLGLPRAERMAMGSIALGIESATAPVRADDEVLCGGGAAEVAHDLAANGDKPLQEVPGAPGAFGKTYGVPPAPGYRPGFVAPDQWRSKQAGVREALPAILTRLLTPPAEATPPAASK